MTTPATSEPGAPGADAPAFQSLGRVLASIAGSTFELEPTLDRIAAEARTFCQADAAFCFVKVGDSLQAGGNDAVSPEFWAWLRANPMAINRATAGGRAVVTGEIVHLPDVTLDPEYQRQETITQGKYRAVLAVPIRSDDEVIGGFILGRHEPGPYSDEAISLAPVFADQSAIAIRLARLLAAGQQAQDRERSLAQVLAAIAAGSFDLDQVLQAIIDEACRLCAAETGNIAVRDGETYRIRATVGFGSAYREAVEHAVYTPTRGSVIGRTLLERRVMQIHDVLADPDYALPDLQKAGGYRTAFGVPIWLDGEIIGVIATARNEVRPFTDREVSLVETFASQVAIALNLARLLTETRDALERQSAIGEVLQTISRSTFELQKVLQTVIDSAVRLTHATDGNILRDEGGTFRMAAYTAGVPESFRSILNRRPFVAERGSVMGRALMDLGPVQVADVLADPEYTLGAAQGEAGFRTMLGIPLLHDGVPIGALAVWRLEIDPFSPSEVALLQTFADQAAIAISNVKLFETVERQRTELARFAPEVAGMLTTEEGQALLAGHRREISALFCDLRGFTAFTEMAEPEELFTVLRQYHAAVGEIVTANGGTVEHFAGDGLMVFFNDPTPLPDHQMAAVRSACAMRDRFAELSAGWRKRGYELGLGIGIAVGYATLGRIGFEGRHDYAAIGPVVNLASRLSDVAEAGEILINQRLHAMVEDEVDAKPIAGLELKGFSHAVAAYRILSVRE